jgi:hypothetical protein
MPYDERDRGIGDRRMRGVVQSDRNQQQHRRGSGIMKRLRVSIAGLVGIIAVIATGMAALRYASDGWASLIAFLTLALLFTSILGAIHGTDRAFWRGVAIFGWGFLLLDAFSVSWVDRTIRPGHVLSQLFTDLYPVAYHDPPRVPPGSKGFGGGMGSKGGGTPGRRAGAPRPVQLYSDEHQAFMSVGIWLSRLLFALLGGIIGRLVIPSRSPPEA